MRAEISGAAGGTTRVPFRITFESGLAGEFSEENTLPLVRDEDGWRVAWTPSTIFAELGTDGCVDIDRLPSGRGKILDRHGEPLAYDGQVDDATIEALERAYPMRVLRYRLREGSGGAGRFRGGEGIERDLQVLEDCTISLITERRVSQPWGLQGGGPGAVGENWLLPGGFERLAKRLPDKCSFRLKAGDVVRMRTPGGGGWGPTA